MEWTDRAVLLGVAKGGRDDLIVNVLTEKHGRQSCRLAQATRTPPTLLPGCSMILAHTPGDLGEPGHATLNQVSGGFSAETVIADEADVDADTAELAGQSILVHVRDLLERLLPPDAPEPGMFDATRTLIQSLTAEAGRWPIYFARWELSLLATLGFTGGLERCRSAFRHGEAIYLSPRSGRAVTREEAGAFLDRMIPVPSFLLGAPNASVTEVGQGLQLTGLMFDRFAGPAYGTNLLPSTRDHVLQAFSEITALPRIIIEPPRKDDDDARRNLRSTTPLLVGRRVAPRLQG